MKLLFFAALLVALGASEVYSQACHLREVDLCTAIGMFHYQSNGMPADEEKVVEWCETMKEVEDCMTNFSTKCLSPLQRELLGLFKGSEDEAKQLCVQGSEMRARYLNHAECLAEGSETDEFKGFLRDLQAVVEKMFDIDYKQRFPLMCCGFRRFHDDSDELTEKRCGKAASELVSTIVHTITTDLPETICMQYDSKSEQCSSLLPPRGTPSKGGDNKPQLAKLLDTVFGNN